MNTDFIIEDGVLVKYTGESEYEVTVPDGVTKIGKEAFKGNYLWNVILPAGVVEIEEGAFENCRCLTTVKLPDGIEWIGKRAFKGCQNLKSINFPQGLKYIWDEAFMDCDELSGVDFPEGLSDIGESAFQGCISLTEVVLPKSVDISEYTFCYCEALDKVVFPEEGALTVPKGAFAGCGEISEVHLGAGVFDIESLAFEGTLIFYLYIGCFVYEIAEDAFDCGKVFDITYDGDEEGFYRLIEQWDDQKRMDWWKASGLC